MRRAVFGASCEQRLDRAGCRFARAKLEHLAEQHEHGDDGRRFEIDRNRAAMAAEGRRENSGRDGADDAVDIGHAGAHRDQREHVEIARHAAIASRARRTASRPTARRAWRTRTGSSSTASGRPSHGRRRDGRPFPARPPAARARGRPRSGASCRQVPDWAAHRGSRPRAPAPCRRSGSFRGRPGGSPDASGRCRSCLPAPRLSACCLSPDRRRDRRRIWCGSRPSRNERFRRGSRSGACWSRDRRSCRRRGRARSQRRGRDDRDGCDRGRRGRGRRSRQPLARRFGRRFHCFVHHPLRRL